MTPFGGWEMPVSYSGITAEHRAVRTAAGLFDVGHMGELEITGPGALDLVQYVTLNDASRLRDGEAQYSAMATPEGGLVDDLLVYRYGAERFMLVVNAANTAKDLRWVLGHGEAEARIRDVSDETGLLAIQGPRAVEVLAGLVTEDIERLPPFGFLATTIAGIDGTLSRTGYTGEDGFELYFPARGSVPVWDTLLEAGQPLGLVPAGLGARNTLRLEASLLLYGNDIDETTTPFEAGLGWLTHIEKDRFVGREALRALHDRGPARKLVGFAMEGRPVARDGFPVFMKGAVEARVTSGAPSVTLGRNIGLVYLPVEHSAPGTGIQIQVRGRLEDAGVVPTPFYRRRRRDESG
jgi:aminomethyltransferase